MKQTTNTPYLLTNSRADTLELDEPIWHAILQLALDYGWEPAGTALNPKLFDNGDVDNWKGSYQCRRLKTVSKEDADRMARALEYGLNQIPDPCWLPAAGLPEDDWKLLIWLSMGDRRDYVARVIAFCRHAPFEIR